MERRKILVVMAAGNGVRMGSSIPKQFLPLAGKMILRRTIETFVSAVPDIKVVTVLPRNHVSFWKEYCLAEDFLCPQTLVSGGITRFHSVRNALAKIPDNAIVAVHDGVRPLVSVKLIREMFSRMESGECRALVPVVQMVDTLKMADTGETLDRTRIVGAQTPQMFFSQDLKEAYSQPYDTSFTDDASVVSKIKIPLSFCKGERFNFKLTSPEDLALAELLISSSCL